MVRSMTELYSGDDTIDIKREDRSRRYNDLCDLDITEEEIAGAIRELGKGRAPGCDGLCAEMVSRPTSVQLRSFCVLFNKVLGGDYPWRGDEKIPLYKTGGRTSPDNYRFIGLQVTFRKIFNKILQRRMTTFIKLDPWQSSFQD